MIQKPVVLRLGPFYVMLLVHAFAFASGATLTTVTIPVTVTPAPPVLLDSAVTRDIDGNGYIDEVELYFSNPVTFPPGFSFSNFVISYTGTINSKVVTVQFPVVSMETMDTSGTRFALHLTEDSTTIPGSPQTAWRPFFSMAATGGLRSIPAFQCRDGAGPVIWMVVKTIANVSDRTQDVVSVIFSEPIQGPNGSPFTPATVKPSSVLVDCRRDTSGMWDTAGSLLPSLAANGTDSLSINSFSRMVNDSTLEFIMSNGKDLTVGDYLNINASANLIYDSRARTTGGPGVAPVPANRKVRVIFLTNPRVIRNAVRTEPFVSTMQSSREFLIVYSGYARGQVSAQIYSMKGQLLRAISGAEQGNGLLLWKYDDRFGRPVTNGCYIIRIFAGSRMFKQKIVLSR
jgi:hypothetical protein